ncbi:efflux RND transporter periplasmic adaptor subunit [Stieleria varia]|uniref:Macrolide transporter subunit MacA n=1 Tax=Stieleria varia TaxID=2528005 RepID=A0A5C6A5H2_9BACT|nr:HlyD family efflux transporter periplasmic adaptor subunit [Stieleria varia]TWT94558.1 macrolide transporter subunit MacA [Stieleria varia]
MKRATTLLLMVIVSAASLCSVAQAQRFGGLSAAEISALQAKINKQIRESGTLESASAVTLHAPFSAAILEITPEGTQVKQGDQVMRLDASAIEQELSTQRTELTNRLAELATVEHAVKGLERDLQGVHEKAEKQIEVANMKLDVFSGDGGEMNTTEQDLAEQLSVAEKKIAAANVAMEVAKQGFESGSADKSAVLTAEASLVAAQAESAMIQRHQRLNERKHALRLAELKLQLFVQQVDLTKATTTLESEIVKGRMQLTAARTAVGAVQSRIAELESKVESSVISAPQDGFVLYPTPRRGQETMEVGVSVRERQELLMIADISNMQVAVTVNETRIARVKKGQKAIIRVDALPDQSFRGTVTHVNATPEPASFLQDSGRQYKVIVAMQDPSDQLRIGMTAMVDIQADKNE